MGKMLRITAPHFVAGACFGNILAGGVVRAAPIIKYMVGWSLKQVLEYCKAKGWDAHFVKDTGPECDLPPSP